MSAVRIGIDVGGTKIAAVVLDAHGEMISRTRVDTPGDYSSLIAAVPAVIERCGQAARNIMGVGIGMPGSQSPKTGLWRNCNMTFVNGRDVVSDLTAAIPYPTRIENDANCFALSEALGGAADGRAVVYALTLGTGVGGGLVIDGRVRRGPLAIAGEAGHMPIVLADGATPRPCYCGNFDCAELFVSGTGMARDHRERTGANLTAPQIIGVMRTGDVHARETFQRWVDRLARLIGALTNALDPDAIVLGGGLSAIDELLDALNAATPRYVFGQEAAPLIVIGETKESGARGAALLWP
ncbi:ROK family protein [Microvirga flavescens]|uniref:ROK family protein n=1 Tax=Microvirga flavescens TaxID=2249811 RepID=UPI000DD63050|nr:ROK family protein [Microvirga flavescens]